LRLGSGHATESNDGLSGDAQAAALEREIAEAPPKRLAQVGGPCPTHVEAPRAFPAVALPAGTGLERPYRATVKTLDPQDRHTFEIGRPP
jgi:hypothetical protein